MKVWWIAGALMAGLAVAAGAFGALKPDRGKAFCIGFKEPMVAKVA
jgi:uncharacterized membrane protein YgdD (TMEM256/DUF423 family)